MKKNLLIAALLFVSLTFLVLLFRQKTTQYPKIAESVSERTVNNVEVGKKEQVLNETKPSNRLDLSNKNLEKLPEYVLSKTNLEELDISNNKISGALPAEIRRLRNLKVLNASNNNMTGVPAEIGQLSKLEVLDLSNNKLTGLPYELGNLKMLKKLNLAGNDYAKQDLEIIKKGLPANVEIILR